MPLYVTEYSRFGRDDRGITVPAAQEPALFGQKLSIGAGSIQSSNFTGSTRIIEVHCDAVCHIKFYDDAYVKSGQAMGATNLHKRMPAGATQFFCVSPGGCLHVIEGV